MRLISIARENIEESQADQLVTNFRANFKANLEANFKASNNINQMVRGSHQLHVSTSKKAKQISYFLCFLFLYFYIFYAIF